MIKFLVLALSNRIEFKSGLFHSYIRKINDNNRNFNNDLSYILFNWINCFIVNYKYKTHAVTSAHSQCGFQKVIKRLRPQ